MAIDIEPATSPAMPAIKLARLDDEAAATPIMRLAVDTIASFEPSTAARSHPDRRLRCASCCRIASSLTLEPRSSHQRDHYRKDAWPLDSERSKIHRKHSYMQL